MTVIIGKTGVSPDAILYVADDETAGGDRHGIATGVRHGLDQLGIGVVTRKFHSGQVKDHRVMTLIGNSGGAAGNRELHAQAGLILPFAGDGLKVMTGSVCIHIDIVCHIAGSVRQRFLVQRLLHGLRIRTERRFRSHMLLHRQHELAAVVTRLHCAGKRHGGYRVQVGIQRREQLGTQA